MKIPTYINGLDDILKDGFIKPSSVLIAGQAGSGKTTFCMQSLINAAKNGETCLYFSFLSESRAMITRAMSQYTFYDNDVIDSGKLIIITVDAGIIEKGDFAIFELINDNIQKYQPSRVVIDPITILDHIFKAFEEREMVSLEKRGFLLNLFSEFEEWNVLLLMTGEFSGNELSDNPWGYMVDGVIMLGTHPLGRDRQRHIEITKMRGALFNMGQHSLKIKDDGINVFPRTIPVSITSEIQSGSASSGIKGLDKMLGSGLSRSTSTLVAGSAGCGKTVMGLHFIANGIINKEPCVIVSFEDEEKEMVRFAQGFGLDLKKYIDEDIFRFIYIPHGYVNPDELTLQLDKVVSEIGAKRVLFDSISGLSQAISDSEELRIYILAIKKYLTNKNITSIFTYELPQIVGFVSIPDVGLPFVMDSIILLRNIEIKAKIRKSILILKMQGEFDNEIREFVISSNGITIKEAFKDYRALMSGTPEVSQQFNEALKAGKNIFK